MSAQRGATEESGLNLRSRAGKNASMPLVWSFSSPLRLVLIFAKGAVLTEEVLNFLAKVDAEKARAHRKIFDVTELTSIFTDEQIRQLAKLVQQRNAQSPIGPIAIVANSEHTYRQAEMFVSLEVTSNAVAVFREHHEARQWLDGLELSS